MQADLVADKLRMPRAEIALLQKVQTFLAAAPHRN
jgi:hypothetical protein